MRGPFAFMKVAGGGGSAPTVVAIDVDVGDTAGGTHVVIEVDDSAGATSAAIGGVSLSSFAIDDATHVSGDTGAHATGVEDVTVTNGAGTSSPLANAFEYFNPSSISDLVWWLRADLGVTLNGSNVANWADQSGLADSNRDAAQATADDQPPLNASDADYNGKATVGTFNRASPSDACRLVNAGTWSASYSTYTLALVGHSAADSNRYFTFGSGSNYSSILSNSSNGVIAFAGNASSPLYGDTPYDRISIPRCFAMCEFAGASSKLFANATVTAGGSGTLDADSLGAAALKVGSYAGSSSTFGVTKMAEVFAYSRVLDAAEKLRLSKYINSRYATVTTPAGGVTGWWRGSFFAAPWVGTASNGTSGERDLVTASHDPTVGATLNGHDAAAFDGTQYLQNTEGADKFLSNKAYRVWGWIYATAASAPAGGGATPYVDRAVASESGGNWGITCTTDGVGVYHYDGGYKVATKSLSLGSWHFFDIVYDGTNLTVYVDGVAGTPVAAGTLATVVGATLFLGTNYNHTVGFEGEIVEIKMANSALAGTSNAYLKTYGNARYGLSL